MTQSGKSRQLSSSDVIGDHLALRFNLGCGVMSATAQLCSPTISPKVVCDSLILALSIDPLSATAQLCSPTIYPKVVCDFLIPALPRLAQILPPVKQW